MLWYDKSYNYINNVNDNKNNNSVLHYSLCIFDDETTTC